MPRPRPQTDATRARPTSVPAPRAFDGAGIDGPTFRNGAFTGPALHDTAFRGTGSDGPVAPQQMPQQARPPHAPISPMSASQGPTRSRTAPAAAAPRKRRRWPFVVAGVVLLLIIIIAAANSGNPTPTSTVPVPAVPAVSVPTVPVPTVSVPAVSVPTVSLPTVEAPAAPVASGPATEVGDGTYEVGVDMVAGKYKTPGPGSDSVMKMCYQERAKNDSGELGSIISNDIVQGPGVMTVKAGEVVKLSGGCQWTKQ